MEFKQQVDSENPDLQERLVSDLYLSSQEAGEEINFDDKNWLMSEHENRGQKETILEAAYSHPDLNGSPGFREQLLTDYTAESESVFSPVKKLEFSNMDEMEQELGLSSDYLVKDLTSKDHGVKKMPVQNGTVAGSSQDENEDFCQEVAEISAHQKETDEEGALIDFSDDIDLGYASHSGNFVYPICSYASLVPKLNLNSKDPLQVGEVLSEVRNITPESEMHRQVIVGLPPDSVQVECDGNEDGNSQVDADDNNCYKKLDEAKELEIGEMRKEETGTVDVSGRSNNVKSVKNGASIKEHRYPADGRNKQPVKQMGLKSKSQQQQQQLPHQKKASSSSSVSFQPPLRSVPYGAEKEEKYRPKVPVSKAKPSKPPRVTDRLPTVGTAVTENGQQQQKDDDQQNSRLTRVLDRTKFMLGESKHDMKLITRPGDMPGGAVQEVEILRGQLQSIFNMQEKTTDEKSFNDHSELHPGYQLNPSDLNRTPRKDSLCWLEDGTLDSINQLLESYPNFPPQVMSQTPSDLHLQLLKSQLKDLKVDLEKEREMRIYSENSAKKLSMQLYDVKQQLAVALTLNKRKNAVAEQVDKQVADLVKKMKSQRSSHENKLKESEERSRLLEIKNQSLEEIIKDLQEELSEMSEAKKKSANELMHVKEKVHQLETKKQRAEDQLATEREKLKSMMEEAEHRQQKSSAVINELQDRIRVKENDICTFEQDRLKKIEQINEDHQRTLKKEKAFQEQVRRQLEEAERKLQQKQTEITKLQHTADEVRREKESLVLEMEIANTKHESGQRQLEMELKEQMKIEVQKVINSYSVKMKELESSFLAEHNLRVSKLRSQHDSEVQQLKLQHQEERMRLETECYKQIQQYADIVKNLQEDNQKVTNSRAEICNKLHLLMSSNWKQTVSILSSQSSLPDSGQMSHSSEHLLQDKKAEVSRNGPTGEYLLKRMPMASKSNPQVSSPIKDTSLSLFSVKSTQLSEPPRKDDETMEILANLPKENMLDRQYLYTQKVLPALSEYTIPDEIDYNPENSTHKVGKALSPKTSSSAVLMRPPLQRCGQDYSYWQKREENRQSKDSPVIGTRVPVDNINMCPDLSEGDISVTQDNFYLSQNSKQKSDESSADCPGKTEQNLALKSMIMQLLQRPPGKPLVEETETHQKTSSLDQNLNNKCYPMVDEMADGIDAPDKMQFFRLMQETVGSNTDLLPSDRKTFTKLRSTQLDGPAPLNPQRNNALLKKNNVTNPRTPKRNLKKKTRCRTWIDIRPPEDEIQSETSYDRDK